MFRNVDPCILTSFNLGGNPGIRDPAARADLKYSETVVSASGNVKMTVR
jgi:hypothetical protein